MTLRFEQKGLTGYAGLELVRGFLRKLDVRRRMRDRLERRLPKTDFGAVNLVLLIVAMILVGGRRLYHLKHLHGDPMLARFSGLRRLPSSATVSRWLSRFDAVHVDALQQFNEEVSAGVIESLGLRRLTLDIDGSVISTGLQVEGAKRGYNPHHRKNPSYYPITAYEAQSGQLLRVENRPGNIHDGKASLGFLEDLIGQVRVDLPAIRHLEMRMDGAFFRRDVLDLLDEHRIDYAIKVPFWNWLDLKQKVADTEHWCPLNDEVEFVLHYLRIDAWDRDCWAYIYRRRVHHESAKKFQRDLFDPDDGHYEYSAIATNKDMCGENLWHFMCGRGSHEKAYAELKNGFAFDAVPSQRYHANSAWQLLSVLAFNLVRAFHVATGVRRARSRTRRTVFRFPSIHTARYEWLNRPGLFVSPNGTSTLDVGPNPKVHKTFASTRDTLAKAA